jgi:hypothetical protein
MPRIDARILCSIDESVNLTQLASAIESAITSITGGDCRVVINRNNTNNSAMDAYKIKQSMRHNNIENMKSLGR